MCVCGVGAQPAPLPAFPPQLQASDATGWGQPVGPGPFPAASCWGRIDSLGLDPNEENILGQPQVPPGGGTCARLWGCSWDPGSAVTLPCHPVPGLPSCPNSETRHRCVVATGHPVRELGPGVAQGASHPLPWRNSLPSSPWPPLLGKAGCACGRLGACWGRAWEQSTEP